MSKKMVSEFSQNVSKMVASEIEQLRGALRSIEKKLDLPLQSASLLIEMSSIGLELEIALASDEGKAQEKKGRVRTQ